MTELVKQKAAPRGMTLIEAMLAMAVMFVGAGGIISAQLIAVRQNQHGKRLGQATTLITDFQENITRWDYADTRLTALDSVNDFTDTEVTDKWEMGSGVTPNYTAQFSDKDGDANATTDDALGATYQGANGDFDNNGTPELVRYWNVFNVDLNNTGTPDGKLVQIIVRWRDPGFGFRQISSSTFKRNPAKVF